MKYRVSLWPPNIEIEGELADKPPTVGLRYSFLMDTESEGDLIGAIIDLVATVQTLERAVTRQPDPPPDVIAANVERSVRAMFPNRDVHVRVRTDDIDR